jgi:ribosomal protein S18 acetylase RimI-like enzyme
VVDLPTVASADLEALWQYEEQWWRERLLWDVSDALAALRRVVERRSVAGKAVRVGSQTVGYAYYAITGYLGVLSALVVLPEWSNHSVGECLLQATVDAMRRQGVARIESPCVSMHHPWLVPAFERHEFQTYWREFLRVDLHRQALPAARPDTVQLEPWRRAHLGTAGALMQAAYAGTVDVEINGLYRHVEDCCSVLDNLVNQGGCGTLVADASALAYHRGQAVGFVVVTEIAPRQGHLAQVAVLPAYQRQGIGHHLVRYSLARLATLHFDTLSLIVSRANDHALRLYQALGLQPVLAFPVVVWEQSKDAY